MYHVDDRLILNNTEGYDERYVALMVVVKTVQESGPAGGNMDTVLGVEVLKGEEVPDNLVGKTLVVKPAQLSKMPEVGDLVVPVRPHPPLQHDPRNDRRESGNWSEQMSLVLGAPGTVESVGTFLGAIGVRLKYEVPPMPGEPNYFLYAAILEPARWAEDKEDEDMGDVVCHTCSVRVGETYPVESDGHVYQLCRKCLRMFQCKFLHGADGWLKTLAVKQGMLDIPNLKKGDKVVVVGPPADPTEPYDYPRDQEGGATGSWNPRFTTFIGTETKVRRVDMIVGLPYYCLECEDQRRWYWLEVRKLEEES